MSLILIGVLGALAVAATGAAIKWGRQITRAVMARLRPDHKALGQRPAWALISSGASGGRGTIRVLAAAAPTRSRRHQDLDPDRAIPFVRESFPGMFPDEPAQSLPDLGIKFTVSADGSPKDGFAWAWATGRVDLATDISIEPGPDGKAIVAIGDILRPIALLARAISSAGYEAVYGRNRFRLPKRWDWFIVVSTGYVRSDGATVPWDDLEFPGRRPPRAGGSQQPFCPPQGYAAAGLRSWKNHHAVSKLLAVFLKDFLKQNGYHAVDDAVDDAIGTFSAAEVTAARPEYLDAAKPQINR